jgi:phosphatidate cytidylyltransferase
MRRILTAAALIPLVLLLVLKGSPLAITLASACVAVLCAWEFLGLADASGAKTPRICVVLAVAALFVCSFERPEYLAPVLGALSFLLFGICTFRAGQTGLSRVLLDTGSSVFAMLYCGLAMTAVPALAAGENGPSVLIFLMFAVWAGDIAALYVGRTLGHHKLAPSLSPGKTWEGSVASLAASVLVTAVLVLLSSELSRRSIEVLLLPGAIVRWLLLAVLVNLAAQAGDLLESAVKRGAQVKDSGTLLPGHGGVLDRVDALLLAAPVLWYALLVQQAF